MNRFLPAGSLLGELTIDNVLINYDGPKLFSCINELGRVYLALSVEDADDGVLETFLYAPTDSATIREVTHGRLPLRQVFEEPSEPHVWVVTLNYVDGISKVEALLASDIDNDWLPVPGVGLPPRVINLVTEGNGYDSRFEKIYGSETAMAMTLSVDTSERPSADSVECRVGLSILGQSVWGDSARPADGILLSAIVLCQFFARNWVHLALEEELPMEISIGNLEHIRRSFQSSRASSPPSTRRYSEAALEAFYATHDLARSATNTALPSVLIAKQGLQGWILRESSAQNFSMSSILSTIEEFVSDLVAVLTESGTANSGVASEWENRWDRAPIDLTALATRRAVTEVEALIRLSPAFNAAVVSDPKSLTRSEVVAAARMTRGLSLEQTAAILEEIGSLPSTDITTITTLSTSVRAAMANSSFPYDEGLEAARALRRELFIPSEEPINPRFILEQSLGVTVRELSIESARSLDAFSAWGPNFGPAVVVNVRGFHNGGNGRNATLAHELGHLIMDRVGALPVADVLLGSQQNDSEARARAFAAELLLPQQIAKSEFASWAGSLGGVIRRLSTRFHVSKAVAAWNLYNSGAMLTEEERHQLRAIAGVADSGASPAVEP